MISENLNNIRLIVSILILIIIAGCTEPQSKEVEQNHHAGEEKAIDGNSQGYESFEDVSKLSCEHDKLIIECDKCRYEAGVVKIDPCLMKSENADAGSLEVYSAANSNPEISIEATGEIQPDPDRIVQIRAKTTGQVISFKQDIGQTVQKNQVILEMDSNEYHELVLEFLRLDSLLELAQKNFDREEKLFQKKLTTEKEFFDTSAEVAKLKIEIDTILRKLYLIGLTSEEIKLLKRGSEIDKPQNLPVRTPLPGSVIERKITTGELVETNHHLATVGDLSIVWIQAQLNEKDSGILHSIMNAHEVVAEVSVDAYPDRVFSGTMNHIADQVDEQTRTVPARIVIDNSDRLLKIGMFTKIKLYIPGDKSVLMVPRESVLTDEDESFVFKKVGDSLFFKQPVKTGRLFKDQTEILEGLQENDIVVAKGAFILKSEILKEKMGAGCAD